MRRDGARSAEGSGAGVVRPAYRSLSTGRPAAQRWSRGALGSGDRRGSAAIGPGPHGFFATAIDGRFGTFSLLNAGIVARRVGSVRRSSM